jgi:hypothetical protein
MFLLATLWCEMFDQMKFAETEFLETLFVERRYCVLSYNDYWTELGKTSYIDFVVFLLELLLELFNDFKITSVAT